ncbi:helix-turn-helix transcriptional regulator [Epibacterium ulvae]|uniref:helix-turn-helix transcriptional regulator n=1 Tax=Epibacterium ulvae TaxID=1156985 RepID=UPI0031E5B716
MKTHLSPVQAGSLLMKENKYGETGGYMSGGDSLDQILNSIEAVTHLNGLDDIMLCARSALQVKHAAYLWIDANGQNLYFGTFRESWSKRYRDAAMVRVDPVITGCFQRFDPVDWRDFDWTSKLAHSFWAEAENQDVGTQGYSIPVRGPQGQFALLSLTHSCDDQMWGEFTAAHGHDLILLAHFLHRKILRLATQDTTATKAALSPREVDALTLLAFGHSRAQVAEMLSISEHTLRVYIEGARSKLEATNTTHAIARATSNGLIVV